MARRELYQPGTGTPPGYRWITIHEASEASANHPLQYRHILVREADGTITDGPRALRGAHVALVAPETARRHGYKLPDDVKRAARLRTAYRQELQRIQQVKRDMLASADENAHLMYRTMREEPTIIQQIQRSGLKIRMPRDYHGGDIPLSILRKDSGETLDTVARQFGYEYGDDLLQAIRTEQRLRRAQPKTLAGWRELAHNHVTQSDDWRILDDLEADVRRHLAQGPRPPRNRPRKRQRRSAA
jgi:hypothetical protein